ncbi:MAG TPA: glutamate racemase [Candidatus Saccharimonadia bacterium]|nr:glutamate racemase [Candidatus Saccharimonadia bacterium]
MKIGVFDSGIGGLSVARAIEKALPKADVLFVHDTPNHFPYATKSPEEIYGFIVPIFQDFVDKGCNVIVIACNTVSTTLGTQLRKRFAVPLITVEPMIQAAVLQTKTGSVAVCATPTTLASKRYGWLKETYGNGCRFIEPDCADWSSLIEHNQMSEARIRQEIVPALDQGADVIVLGCTHYHWIEEAIRVVAEGRAHVIQPEAEIVEQLKRLLGL